MSATSIETSLDILTRLNTARAKGDSETARDLFRKLAVRDYDRGYPKLMSILSEEQNDPEP